jgi:hypothetical protein
MDRRAKKKEKARKRRELLKKQARAETLRRERAGELLVRSAASAPFGPCWLSLGWDDEQDAALVSALVTRRLGDGRLLPATALVDRTCLGLKDGFLDEPLLRSELDVLCERLGAAHGGMVECEPITVQSVVFHAIDYARRLGFEPHPDAPLALFGPRPQALLPTPWCAEERPLYVAGAHDDVDAILARLTAVVGPTGFDFVDFDVLEDDDDDDEGFAVSGLVRGG